MIELMSCAYCGAEYRRYRQRSRLHMKTYCSADCRVAGRARKEPIGTCVYCGEQYEKIDQRSRYCSRSCRSANRRVGVEPVGKGLQTRARRFGVEYEQVSKLAVYERDKWRCGICYMLVNPELRYPHPMSASLDHIVPMSRGGGHTYANCQCSHLRCNIEKRDCIATIDLCPTTLRSGDVQSAT